MDADPFTQVYNKIWELIENNDKLNALVAPGNRIKLVERRTSDPGKKRHGDSDFPEMIIEPAGGKYQPFATSTGSTCLQSFKISMRVANLLLDKDLFPVKWALFKAFASFDSLLALSFVRGFSLAECEDSENDEGSGWRSVVTITVQMWFSKTELTA